MRTLRPTGLPRVLRPCTSTPQQARGGRPTSSPALIVLPLLPGSLPGTPSSGLPTAPQPPTGAGSLPFIFASFQALPVGPGSRPHLVVVGLTVGQALLLIVPVPQERLLTLGTDEVLEVEQGGQGSSGLQQRPQETE